MAGTLRVSIAPAYSANSARTLGDGSTGGCGGAGVVTGAGAAAGGPLAAAGDGGSGAVTGGGFTSGTTAGAVGAFRHTAIATESSAAASAVRRAPSSESARVTALSPRAITSAATP